ncbi:hypothetical protein ACLKA6_000420, partial [Drosophila palustris]
GTILPFEELKDILVRILLRFWEMSDVSACLRLPQALLLRQATASA